jgi:hypothetical protein
MDIRIKSSDAGRARTPKAAVKTNELPMDFGRSALERDASSHRSRSFSQQLCAFPNDEVRQLLGHGEL